MATVRIQLRRGTASEWTTTNPVLAAGEAGIETDTRKIKFGDGSTTWSALGYLNAGDIAELSQDAVNTALVAGTGLDKVYNDSSNTITLDIDSTVTTNSGEQTLTNKTISGNSNTISLKSDTSENWSEDNPVLAIGEIGIETDTSYIKIGNGSQWNSILTYANVVPSDLDSTLGDYVLLSDVGGSSGVAGLNNTKDVIVPGSSIIVEGGTPNDFEVTLTVTDPTADRTITFPDLTGTVALQSYVDDSISNLIDSSPATLNTLNELAAAINDDASFASTITTALGTKLPLAGGTMTGAIAMGTSKITGLGNPTDAQDAVTKDYLETQLVPVLVDADLGYTVAELVTGSVPKSQLPSDIVYDSDLASERTAIEESAASDAASQISTHSSDTTQIHGIADTAELATKSFAAELLTGATKTNITISGDKNGLTISAENGVADSTTDDLTEGSTNKYFTDERAQDAVASALAAGTHTNITVTYVDDNNKISLAGSPEYVDEQAVDAVATALANGTHTNITVDYSDSTNAISLTGSPTYTDENARDAAAALITDSTHSGISVAYTDSGSSEGTLAFTNTGVTSLTGTANEVTVSGSTGSVTVGLPDNVTIGNNLVVYGNLNVQGTTTSTYSNTVATHDNLIYLNAAIDTTVTNAVGDGTYVTYTADNTYAPGMDIRVTGMNPSSFNISTEDGLTVYSATSTQFVVAKTTTDTFVAGGTAHAKSEVNPDLGFAGGYYDELVGYTHAGLFRDASDGKFKVFEYYAPEPDEAVNIDTSDPSFSLATFAASAIEATSATIGDVSNTELQYLNGVTSAIQTQIDSKAPVNNASFTGTFSAPTGTITSAMIADGTIVNGDINASAAIDWTKLAISSTVSSTEIGYVDGVTSAIQTQLNSKTPEIYTFATVASGLTISSSSHKYGSLKVTSGTAINIVVPTDAADAGWNIGDYVEIYQYGDGQVTVTHSGVTVNSADSNKKTRVKFSAITLIKMGTNEWLLVGDTTA